MTTLALTALFVIVVLPEVASAIQPDTLVTPEMTTIRLRRLPGILALIPAGVLFLLKRALPRPYLNAWIAFWLGLAALMFIVSIGSSALNLGVEEGRAARMTTGRLLIAVFALTWVGGMTMLMLSAGWYRAPMRLPRWLQPAAVITAVWFIGGALTIGLRAVVGGMRVLGLVLFIGGGIAFLRLARRERLAGALIIGVVLVAIPFDFFSDPTTAVGPFTIWFWAFVYAFLALGMHLLVFEDVTHELRRRNADLREAQAQLRTRAVTDPLTGCYNRHFFDEIAAHELRQHQRYKQPMAVLFVDCNGFKNINDALGHDMGDRVLTMIGQLLRVHVREGDYVFRWGGDEFVLLLTSDEQHALAKAQEISEAFRHDPLTRELPVETGLTIGVAPVASDADDLLGYVHVADERMYALKRQPA